jgi:hypothetical protein
MCQSPTLATTIQPIGASRTCVPVDGPSTAPKADEPQWKDCLGRLTSDSNAGAACRSGGEAPRSARGCGNSRQPRNGNFLVRPFGGGRVFRIEMSNPLAPHSDERPRCQLIHRFPRLFDGRNGIAPDRAFAAPSLIGLDSDVCFPAPDPQNLHFAILAPG